MKPTLLSAILIATASTAGAEGMVERLCGAGHANEAGSAITIQANPDGYFVSGLNEQISHGDPRLIMAVGQRFHLCTRSAATPEMDAAKATLLMGERRVKYLFVPNCPHKVQPGS